MNILNKLKKKKPKKIAKRKINKDSSDEDQSSSNKSTKEDNYKKEIAIKKEDNKWIDILKSEMENYELDNSSNKNSSSDSEKNLPSLKDKKIAKKEIPEDNKKKINISEADPNNINEIKSEEIFLNIEKNIDSKCSQISMDLLVYNGKQFKNFATVNKYNEKRKIKKIIYKCQYLRKDEKLRKETKQPPFCQATIEYIEPGQNVKSGYFFKREHSFECEEMGKAKIKLKEKLNVFEDKIDFISKCENIMNSSTIFDRQLFKESFKKLYNDENVKYKFPLDNNFLSNIINKWKNNTYRFKKECILYDTKDYENRLIFREYRIIPQESESNNKNNFLEYIIWGNAENIMRIKASKNLFIDGTFHHPPDFYQMLIIMYKDIITGLKIPGLYILLNSKREILYEIVFESIIRNILKTSVCDLNFETIVTDQELALINVIKKVFPKSQRISCLFHYKQDILRNLKSYGLYKKDLKENSDIILKKLGNLPFIYKGDLKIFEKECIDIKNNYPLYTNFIDNYFIINKKSYFIDGSLDYLRVPKDCRTNNFLENYNGYIKSKLGKHRLIN